MRLSDDLRVVQRSRLIPHGFSLPRREKRLIGAPGAANEAWAQSTEFSVPPDSAILPLIKRQERFMKRQEWLMGPA